MPKQTINVIGMGYIGLPTATIFAAEGYEVYGYDTNPKIIQTLKNGEIHIKEPDLLGLFKTVLEQKKLIPSEELKKAEVHIVCVPTPFQKRETKRIADLSLVIEAAKSLGDVIEKGNTVILESTVPPKTTEGVFGRIIEERSGLEKGRDFHLAHCPERVLPGKILYELKNNHRIIGTSDSESAQVVKELYSAIVKGGEIYITDTKTAEMCKLIENAYRDVNIAFANELSILCDEINIDVWELIRLANKHPRVQILSPGAGVGGHCISVDPWFLVESFPANSNLIKQARQVNDSKPHWIVSRIENRIKSLYAGKEKRIKLGILGLAYKPDIGDLRESPSLEIADSLVGKGYQVLVCEPNCSKNEINGLKNLCLQDILVQSDCIITTVAHQEFKTQKEAIKAKEIFRIVEL
ncbi:MAG TPA: nucleotide sugar dehydrogenase [Thermotogota bacterium]|nr:nucleotide sugar dehydrogenase [Thermotogota bacterium]HOS23893.1 nucleotide sugar dehydrogenase [Thermotogota bacterium]HOT87271.1 nucleotide sugar dehydrogenase [Thermotogota bacterium]HPD36467.1 nucleotide sugar dehydrogenase [Thermotogota bacterium]HPL37766.1 nucleotide sugar dehydrogenase [Thermotogota bacterium]